MGIIRCEHPCRHQSDGYCKLKRPTTINQRDIARTGCAFFEEKKGMTNHSFLNQG